MEKLKKRKFAWERQKSIHKCWNIEEVKLMYRRKLDMDEPSNILGFGLDSIDSPKKRVEKWLCKNKTVEQQNARQCKTPKRMLTVQLPIRLFNSSK